MSSARKEKKFSTGLSPGPLGADLQDEIEFTLNGEVRHLARSEVVAALADVEPEPISKHYSVIDGTRYPVKQAFSQATGVDRADFGTNVARRMLSRLGFETKRSRS